MRIWESPETVGVNRLGPHAVRREPDILLDGTWRFQLLDSPTAPVGPRWDSITVPGSWTTSVAGDLPQYTNWTMPWPGAPLPVPARNPTGVHERDVLIPASYLGRRVILHVGAAESVLLVSVDGVPVGASKDSHLPAEFDITAFVRPGFPSTIRLTVVKWSDASTMEDQDQWWLGGLTRSVFLYALPPAHLSDVRVIATAGGTLQVDVRVSPGGTVAATLDGRPVPFDAAFDAAQRADDRVSDWLDMPRLRGSFPDVTPWSAETPVLYPLVVTLHTDGVEVDRAELLIGFRDVRVDGRDLLVNGQRVFIRGVNRHDFDPLTGRTVTRDQMRDELCLLKRHGFNAIRTSHYPNDPALLDLADELGFYVVDEADIETHDHAHELASDPRYLPAFVDRVARMVCRDRNHPSVIIWSLGNESDYGANHDAAAAWIRHDDPTRPLQYEGAIREDWHSGGVPASDIVCPMYPTLESIAGWTGSRPLIMCEYSHAMGNSNGTLAEHWAVIESTPGLQGGFIWEFWDHGILQRLSDGRPAGPSAGPRWSGGVAAPGFRWAYGGDFGDRPNDGPFCADGIVLPDRTPKPVMAEHRELAAPVRMTPGSTPGTVTVTNRQHFRDLSWLAASWLLDGAAQPATLPALGPGESATLSCPVADGPAESWLTLVLVTADDLPWAPAGTEIARPQLRLRPETRPLTARLRPGGGPRPEIGHGGGLLHPLIAAGPVLSLWRAPTDNDRIAGHAARWTDLGLQAPERELVEAGTWAYRTAGGVVTHRQTFEAAGDALLITDEVTVPDGLDDLPRIGIVLEVVPGLDVLEWFGHGPGDTYPDRHAGGPVGRYTRMIDEAFTPYLRPQESGGRSGVREMTLHGPAGALHLVNDEPRQVSVTRYRAADLDAATHHDELVPRPGAILHLDVAHRGLGTASCGPDTLPSYTFGPGRYRWTWALAATGP